MSDLDFRTEGQVAVIGDRKVVQITSIVVPGPPTIAQVSAEDAEEGGPPPTQYPVPGPAMAMLIALCGDGTLWLQQVGDPRKQWHRMDGPPKHDKAGFSGDPRGGAR